MLVLKAEELPRGGSVMNGANLAGLGQGVFLAADFVPRRGIGIYGR